jgi:hypothetical protein
MSVLAFRRAAIEAFFDRRGLSVWAPSARQPADWGTREGLEATMLAAARGEAIRLDMQVPTLVVAFLSLWPAYLQITSVLGLAVSKAKLRLVPVEADTTSNFHALSGSGRARFRAVLRGRKCLGMIIGVLQIGSDSYLSSVSGSGASSVTCLPESPVPWIESALAASVSVLCVHVSLPVSPVCPDESGVIRLPSTLWLEKALLYSLTITKHGAAEEAVLGFDNIASRLLGTFSAPLLRAAMGSLSDV